MLSSYDNRYFNIRKNGTRVCHYMPLPRKTCLKEALQLRTHKSVVQH